MGWIPTPALVAGCGFLPLGAAALLRGGAARKAAAVAVALAALLAWGEPFCLRYTKYYDEDQDRLLWEKWTPTARLTVFSQPFFQNDPSFEFLWGEGRRYVRRKIEQLWLEQDGSAGTPITRLAGGLEALAALLEHRVDHPAHGLAVLGVEGAADDLHLLQ